MKTSKRKAASAIGGIIVFLLIVLVAAMAFYELPPGTSVAGHTIKPTTTSAASATTTSGSQDGKIDLYINDPLAGSGNNAPTFKIYPAAGSLVGGQTFSGTTPSDTPTISSSGTGTTSSYYSPGTSLYGYASLTNYETEYYKFTAPGATSSQISGGTWTQVNIPQMKLPTVSISATDDQGNAISSTGHINFTTLAESSVQVTFTVTNTATNTGYLSYYDPINQVDSCLAVQAKEGGSNVNIVGVSGYASSDGSMSVGTVRYVMTDLPDGYQLGSTQSTSQPTAPIVSNAYNDQACGGSYSSATGGITKMTQGSSNPGGSITFTLTFKKGSLAAGQSCSWTFQIYEYANLPYALSNSASMGPSAATLGSTFVLNVQD